MPLRVIISEPAELDLWEAHNWWAKNRSPSQAATWYRRILAAIHTLKDTANRWSAAPEHHLWPTGIRELHFGVRRKPTHRVLFTIENEQVIVLRVRHASQDYLTAEDFS